MGTFPTGIKGTQFKTDQAAPPYRNVFSLVFFLRPPPSPKFYFAGALFSSSQPPPPSFAVLAASDGN